jgi:hypothetical protein
MAISRAQIPEQIDVFAPGGGVGETTTPTDTINEQNYNQLVRLLDESLNRSAVLDEFKPDYEASYQKYYDRLSPFLPQRKSMNIYDVAAELGKGLLSTPNTGVGSAYIGIGVGFDRVSDRLRAAKIEDEKARREVGMKAAQMAMQDEQRALDFLNDYEMKRLEIRNKRGDLLTFEYKDENGNIVQESVRDNVANDAKIDELLAKGAVSIGKPTTQLNINTGKTITKRDEKAQDAQIQSEDEAFQKYRSGVSSLANLEEAYRLAIKLGPENFGTVSKISLYPRQLLSSLGLTDENQDEIIGNQILIGQISLGFTMDIVSRTKGAISNREMEMFERASPGLGSNYNGYLKQVDYLQRVAKRDVDFYEAYIKKAEELEAKVEEGEISETQLNRQLRTFEADWYDENLLFNKVVDGELVKSNYSPEGSIKDEFGELEKIAAGDYTDETGMLYQTSQDLDVDTWRKSFRDGQDEGSNIKSTLTTTKNDEIQRLQELRKRTQTEVTDPVKRQELLDTIDASIRNLQI